MSHFFFWEKIYVSLNTQFSLKDSHWYTNYLKLGLSIDSCGRNVILKHFHNTFIINFKLQIIINCYV